MNIFVFNPEWVKVDALEYLFKILKIDIVYNLIELDFITPFISDTNCNLEFDIRRLNRIDDESWKQGVYSFINRISTPIYSTERQLMGRRLKEELIDSEHSNVNPFYNLKNSSGKNVMVLHNKYKMPFSEYLQKLIMYKDFVAYARNLIMKYTDIGHNISNSIVSVCINPFILPQAGTHFKYVPIVNSYKEISHYEWRPFLMTSKTTGRRFCPIASHIIRSFREDYGDGEQSITIEEIRNELLSEKGILRHQQFVANYDEFIEEDKEELQEEARMEERAERDREFIEDCNRQFNSMMNDFDAWGNID